MFGGPPGWVWMGGGMVLGAAATLLSPLCSDDSSSSEFKSPELNLQMEINTQIISRNGNGIPNGGKNSVGRERESKWKM